MAESGTITWPGAAPVWSLRYVLGDSSAPEGIALHAVRFRGRQVLYKASLPSLRVQYDGTCGPYKDPLFFDLADTQANGRKVAVYDYTWLGIPVLTLESYFRIGAYRLRQRWTFGLDGRIQARLFSAGLQCNDDHRHHAYWRFDFDINDAANDAVYEFNTTTPNVGFGPGWHKKLTETSRVKNPGTSRRWAVMDKRAGNGYFVIPGSGDGMPDAFSQRDLWVIRYRGTEDRSGNQGSAGDDGLDAYLDFEDIDGADVVVWYCGHLAHHVHDGADEWHATGPSLVPFRW